MKRRGFIDIMLKSLALTSASALTILGIFPTLLTKKKKVQKINLGKKDKVFIGNQFIVKKVDDVTMIIKKDNDGKIQAFNAACTHAGCPVQWTEESNSFLCKCHGGVFNEAGIPTSGPPRKSLQQFHVQVKPYSQEILIYVDRDIW